jgi:hypothetical protein
MYEIFCFGESMASLSCFFICFEPTLSPFFTHRPFFLLPCIALTELISSIVRYFSTLYYMAWRAELV